MTGSLQKCDGLVSTASTGMNAWLGEALEGLQPLHMYLCILRVGKRAVFTSLTIPGICLTLQTVGLGIRINNDNCISRTRGTISVQPKSSSSERSDIFSFTVPEMSVNERNNFSCSSAPLSFTCQVLTLC